LSSDLHFAGHSGYQLRGFVDTGDPAELVPTMFAPLAAKTGGISQFGDTRATHSEVKGDQAAFEANVRLYGVRHYLRVALSDGSALQLVNHHRPATRWLINHTSPPGHGRRPGLTGPYLHEVLLPWLRECLSSGVRLEARVIRQGTSLGMCPDAPIAGGSCQVVITTREAVIEAYDDPAAFWAMFPGVEVFGEELLLTRHLDAHTDDVYYADAWRESWALARAAKPRLTRFGGFRLEDWNRSLYLDTPNTLRLAGYHPVKKDAEFTCVVEADGHVNGREILGLRVLLKMKKLPGGGEPCESVRVVFPSEAMARREKRPLLDVGASVGFIDIEGQLRLVDEADRAIPGGLDRYQGR
jgi:hypothetical protein